MSISLGERLGGADDDTVRTLARAASSRYRDARVLDRAGRRTAAIYLYGYAAESWIKSAYFRMAFAAGHLPPETKIDRAKRSTAVGEWESLGLPKKPGQHDIEGWARLLIWKRLALAADSDGIPRYEPGFANDVIERATTLYLGWREYMRYRAPAVRCSEITSAWRSARWFRDSYPDL